MGMFKDENDERIESADYLSEWFGISKARFMQLAKENSYPKKTRGQYYLYETVEKHIAWLRSKMKAPNSKGGDSDELAEHKTRNERIKADKAEIELMAVTRQLISRDEFVTTMSSSFKIISQALLSLADYMERDCGLPSHALELVDRVVKSLLEEIHEKLKEYRPEEVDE